jgi:PDZ domain
VNQGYHEYENHIVAKVDGTPIVGIRHLVELVESSNSPFVTVELNDGQRLVLDRRRSRERMSEILERFNVRFDRSRDLRMAAAKKAAKKSARPANKSTNKLATKSTNRLATKSGKSAAKKSAKSAR